MIKAMNAFVRTRIIWDVIFVNNKFRSRSRIVGDNVDLYYQLSSLQRFILLAESGTFIFSRH